MIQKRRAYDKLCLPPFGGNGVGVQQGIFGRRLLERGVGVPKLIAQREHPTAVLRAEDVIFLVEIRDIDELPADTGGVGRQYAVLAFKWSEPLGKCNLGFLR